MRNLSLLLAISFLLTNTVVEAQKNGIFLIENLSSGKVLDVPNGSQKDGETIIQWEKNGGTNQKWQLTSMGNGYYTIISISTGKCLDVPTSNEGEKITQYFCSDNNDNQQWRLERQMDRSYVIVSKRSEKALDVPNSSKDNGIPITQWSKHQGSNQRWFLKSINQPPIVANNQPAAQPIKKKVETFGSDFGEWMTGDKEKSFFVRARVSGNRTGRKAIEFEFKAGDGVNFCELKVTSKVCSSAADAVNGWKNVYVQDGKTTSLTIYSDETCSDGFWWWFKDFTCSRNRL